MRGSGSLVYFSLGAVPGQRGGVPVVSGTLATFAVIPAKAGIQRLLHKRHWSPLILVTERGRRNM